MFMAANETCSFMLIYFCRKEINLDKTISFNAYNILTYGLITFCHSLLNKYRVLLVGACKCDIFRALLKIKANNFSVLRFSIYMIHSIRFLAIAHKLTKENQKENKLTNNINFFK